MLRNLKNKLSRKERYSLGGFTYGMDFGKFYYFPLSGRFILKKRKENERNK